MKKMLFISLFLSLISTYIWSEDFRNVNWGMSWNEVMEKEKGTVDYIDEQKRIFTLSSTFAGHECFIKYFFYKDHGLSQVDVIYNYDLVNDIFSELKTILEMKYGEPFFEEEHYFWIISDRTFIGLTKKDFRVEAILTYYSTERFLQRQDDILDEL